jgi:hypothetical protein
VLGALCYLVARIGCPIVTFHNRGLSYLQTQNTSPGSPFVAGIGFRVMCFCPSPLPILLWT